MPVFWFPWYLFLSLSSMIILENNEPGFWSDVCQLFSVTQSWKNPFALLQTWTRMENLLRAKQPDNVCNDKGRLFAILGRFPSSARVQYFRALGLKGKSYTDTLALMWSFLLVAYCLSHCPTSLGNACCFHVFCLFCLPVHKTQYPVS